MKKSVPQEGKPKACKVFVGGLAPETTEEDFKTYFTKFGEIAEVQIMQDHMSGRSRGFGFVTFEEDSSAEAVFDHGSMHDLGGKKVEVKPATPKGTGSQQAQQQQQQAQAPGGRNQQQQHMHQQQQQYHHQQQPQHMYAQMPPHQGPPGGEMAMYIAPSRGRSSAEYDPMTMRPYAATAAAAAAGPPPAGAYQPYMYPTYGPPAGGGPPGRPSPPGMMPAAYAMPSQYMMMAPSMQYGSAAGPSGYYTPQVATYPPPQQQQQTRGGGGAGGGGGSGMPFTPPSPQGMLPHPFSVSSMYPSSSPSPSPPYRSGDVIISQQQQQQQHQQQQQQQHQQQQHPQQHQQQQYRGAKNGGVGRGKVDSASSLDAERQFKNLSLGGE